MTRASTALVAALVSAAPPSIAWAHGFDERYDLPVPLGFFIAGAAAVVGLSLLVAALFARRAPGAVERAGGAQRVFSRPGRGYRYCAAPPN